jgi:aspartate-semialdehyde dehydrogenase
MRVAIVGATGQVGVVLRAILAERSFPVEEMRYLASVRSAGTTLPWAGEDVVVEDAEKADLSGIELALCSAPASVSHWLSPRLAEAGAVVIDNSSAYRMDPNVPLAIPEINGRRIAEHKGIIAVPNCSAITALMPLWPIHRQNRIKRMIISTYQAASGAGAAAMEELVASTRANLAGESYVPMVLPHPYAFNVFNHDTKVDPETGYNEEETKVIKETRKIFEDDTIAIGITCVRVPVLRAHSQAITFECERPIGEREVRDILGNAPGVKIVDDRVKNYFPMPIEASGQDDVLVGRIRRDLSDPSGHSISLFVAADQLLKGAALNAVQIAELLPERIAA